MYSQTTLHGCDSSNICLNRTLAASTSAASGAILPGKSSTNLQRWDECHDVYHLACSHSVMRGLQYAYWRLHCMYVLKDPYNGSDPTSSRAHPSHLLCASTSSMLDALARSWRSSSANFAPTAASMSRGTRAASDLRDATKRSCLRSSSSRTFAGGGGSGRRSSRRWGEDEARVWVPA